MANGDFIGRQVAQGMIQPFGESWKLLDSQSGTTAGPWVDCSLLKHASVEVFGTFTGSVQIEITNQEDPSSSYNGQAVGAALTAPGMVQLPGPARYVRAVPNLSVGSASAFLHGVA